jgi:hypothetical protein
MGMAGVWEAAAYTGSTGSLSEGNGSGWRLAETAGMEYLMGGNKKSLLSM